jgi:outer membrane protein assembly factor BamB
MSNRKIAGPLSNKLPEVETDDWGPAPFSPTDPLNIRVRADPDRVEDAIDAIEALGGTVETSYGRTIHATLSAGEIQTLTGNDAVTLVNEEIEPELHKRTVTEGLEISNTDDVHADGIDGDGAKVAIIDTKPSTGGGFDPNNNKYGGQVVDTIGDSSGFDSQDELHGTGCAEIVYDLAPNADLVLASTANDTIASLLDKIETNHPETDVLSMSLGTAPTDRLDGQDDLSNRIGTFTDGGRIAAISAGNEADGNHWHGPYQDSNGNDIMEFDGSGTEYLKINSPTPYSYVIVNWDDWDNDNQDYILRVYSDSSKTNQIDSAGPTNEPWEAVQFSGSPPSEAYVEIENSAADGNQEFDIFLWGAGPYMEIVESTAARSMSLPSTARDSETLAVAAVQATDKGIEPSAGDLKAYSSQGPTRDDRQGIDIAGPSRVSQTDNGYGSLDDWNPPGTVTGFNGTSAAAPHVAGGAAALFELSGVTNEDIRAALEDTGTGIGDSGVSSPSNTKIGNGYMDVKAAYDSLQSSVTEPLSQKWTSADLGGDAQYNTPAVDSQHVYVGGLQKTVYALSRDDGQSVQWTKDRGNKPGLSDSSVHIWTDPSQNKAIFGSGQGRVFAVDSDDSTEHWSGQDIPNLGTAVTSSPTSHNGTIFAGTNDGRVFAWDGGTAAEQWQTAVSGAVYSDLIAANGRLYVTTADGTLYALDTSDGSTLWSAGSLGDLGASSPTIGGGRVYVAGDEVHAFDESGSKTNQWTSSGYGGTAWSNPTFDSGTIYVGSADGNLYALNASDGSQNWTFSTGGAVASTPAVNSSGDRIAAASTDGTLYLIDSSGSQADTVSIPSGTRASPVIDNGILFLPTASGIVYAFE